MTLNLQNYSQLEQYYILKQLPEFAQPKSNSNQKKDHNYYHDNFNIWNNKSQCTKKNYPYYFKFADEAKSNIQHM